MLPALQFATWLLLALCLLLPAKAPAQPVTIGGGEYAVAGILELPTPRADRPAPGVLMLHGTASQKNEVGDLFRRLAEALARAGIASLRIDFAGTGDSPVGYRDYRLSTATADALRALEYLRSHSAVDAGAVVILGFSQGGLIAQQTALANPDLAALVTWSTVAGDGVGSFQGLFDAHYATARRDGFAPVSFAWLDAPLDFDLRWFEEVRAQRTLTGMRSFNAPILAIAGAADQTVPSAQSVALITQSPHPASRALILAGANHIFNVLDNAPDGGLPPSSRQLLQETVDWIGEVTAAVTPQ